MADFTNLFSRKVVMEKWNFCAWLPPRIQSFHQWSRIKYKITIEKIGGCSSCCLREKLVKTCTELLGKLGEFKQGTLGDREMQQTQGMLAMPIPIPQRIYSLEMNYSKKGLLPQVALELNGWVCRMVLQQKALMKSLYKQRQCEQEQKCDFYLLLNTLIEKLLQSNRCFTMGCLKAHSIYLIMAKKRGVSGWRRR